jgi:hypothetical protein
MKQLTDEVFAQVRDALASARVYMNHVAVANWQTPAVICSEALAALDTAQPVQVNAMLVEALVDTTDFLERHSNRWDGVNGKHPHTVVEAARAALTAAQQAQPEPSVPKGFALVPLRPTSAMEDVFQQDDWQWADVLAAAESVTEEQYLLALEDGEQAQPERAPLSDDAYEALVDDLESWSRHVVEDTAHITLDTHVRRTLAAHGLKQGGQHD